MKLKHFILSLSILCLPFLSEAQSASSIVFIKKSLSKIVSKVSEIKKIADGFEFTEGPVWHKDGYLLFSDIPANKVMKYEPENGVSVYIENSGFVGTEENGDGPGSNGLTFDLEGNLIICQHGARQIVKMDTEGNFTPIARQFGGKRLNSPNDAIVMSNGSIFFTDPPWGLPLNADDPAKELDYHGVYQLKKGGLILIDKDLSLPNGIALSPDEDYLYVADMDGDQKLYYRYELDEDGTVTNKTVFFDASNLEEQGSPDGIKVDSKGNCYFTGPGGVLIVNEKGEHLGTIQLPEQPANIGWGGKEGKTLFMTCRTSLYAMELKIAGIQPMK